MKTRTLQKLELIAQDKLWTQQDMAREFGVGQSTVSRWFDGIEPRGEKWERVDEIYSEIIQKRKKNPKWAEVPLMGYIGAGAKIEPAYEEVPPDGLDRVSVPFLLEDEMIAFKVRGNSMYPVYREDSVIICYKTQRKPITAFYDKEAVVLTADSMRYIKTIMPSHDQNKVNLSSYNAPPIYNVGIIWVGEIFAILPPSN